MPEISFEFVNVIGSFGASPLIVTVDGVGFIPSRTNAEDQRIFRSYGAGVFGISLNSKVENGVFVLVLEERE